MSVLLSERPMAKRTDVAVKMDAEVIRKAKIVAAYRQQTLAEFLSDELGRIVDGLIESEHDKLVSPAPRPKAGPKGRNSDR